MDFLTEPIIQVITDLGAMAAVIIFVVLYMRSREGISSQEQEAREKRDVFIEGLVEAGTEQQAEQMTAWREMTKETLTTFQGYTAAFEELAETHRETCEIILNGNKELHSDHVQMYTELDQASKAIDKLENTVIESRGEIMGRLDR